MNWQLTNPALNREIEGFASHSSINKGETIKLYINTKSAYLSLCVYRMGWYAGAGAIQVIRPITIEGFQQVIPLPQEHTGLIACDWNHPYELETDLNWTSGVYLAKLEEQEYKKQSYIIFVVRDDETSADILFQLPVTTYQAYNYWGGKCLYNHGSGSLENWGAVSGTKAQKVSFDRPYAKSNNPKAAYGMGAGDFLTNTRPVTTHNYPISSAGWDYNMVRWLEKNGYNVKYCTNIDIHDNPHIYLNSKIFLSNGHDEYWSYEMRKNLTDARDTGTNLAFFSSNTMYWQIRFEQNQLTEQKNRIIVCYKEKHLDPIQSEKSTINFEDIPEQGSQAKLIGVQYFADPVLGDIKITNPNHWIFKNSGVKKGTRLKGLLGYEIDGVSKDSPDNITILASTKCRKVNSGSKFIVNHMIRKITNPIFRFINRILNLNKEITNFQRILVLLIIATTASIIGMIINEFIPLIGFLTAIVLFLIWFLKLKLTAQYESNMTIYNSECGSKIFATGSMQWCWGLDNYNVPELRNDHTSISAEIITKNLLKDFGASQKNIS
ncbi:hypothetical protein SAMN04488009_3086 [Maribacter sedimenticola]|uniref:N,N-dimethylformamidase beta subunit-like C-terminal domain-containing protein n=1 Tax=Maribacter sedimenticola TaxID=228956 RepID=A0ABY1SJX2_9FLAO|nr:N,N-dimethylformamidase beta subunit family domain-containing protein [Maribacter sedimenticola]SNR67056.1 hypothetical protein SAMN04488009_3086 [Maribacter sedimenticola]